jgi:hypothetical protein
MSDSAVKLLITLKRAPRGEKLPKKLPKPKQQLCI